MIVSKKCQDKYIISRSFRFISPNVHKTKELMALADYDLSMSYFSTATGDNRYINPVPGFGFNTDPSPAMVNTKSIQNNLGYLGRYYKRMIDDNVSTITLTAGVPEFTGILRFLTGSFDYAASLITSKGRAPTWAFYISEAIGSIAYYPLQLIGTGLNFLAFLTKTPKNSWYYVKDTMGFYLAAAQGIFNDLMVSAGFTTTVMNTSLVLDGNEKRGSQKYYENPINTYDKNNKGGQEDNFKYMNSLYPDAINEDGTIDIARIALRGTRKYRNFIMKLKELDKDTPVSYEQHVKNMEKVAIDFCNNPAMMNDTGTKGFKNVDNILKAELDTTGKFRGAEELTAPEISSAYTDAEVGLNIVPGKGDDTSIYQQNQGGLGLDELREKFTDIDAALEKNKLNTEQPQAQEKVEVNEESWFGKVSEMVKDVFLGGMDSVTFRVEGGNGPVTDNFGNVSSASEIAGMFNGTVNAISNFKFNTQGGTTGFDMIDGMLNRIKDTAAGLAQGSVIGNIPLAIICGSKVSIPDHWSDSTTSLHTESFEIYCEANYAHPYSIATNIFLPLSLIGPFIFPVSSGGSTYTSPFMCKVFSRGRTIIRTGMVKNATITFGEGELGWTRERLPLNMRIRLEFADFEPIVSVPVTRIKNPLELFDMNKLSGQYLGDLGGYNSWVGRVTGRDYLDTMMKFNRINKAVTRFTKDVHELVSPSRVAGAVNDSIIGSIGSLFTPRPLNR